jgi:ubiquinone/menaquinone biosynthesis C-methylase UbiE
VNAALEMIGQDDPQIVRDGERAARIRARRAALAQAYFDENAAEWDRIRSLHVAEREVEEAILEALGPGPYGLLLDLGTGTGRMLELASNRATQLTGIDTNREMLKCARVRLDKAALTNCSVRHADIYNLPFAAGSADAVLVHQVLHFLDNPKAALTEGARVLKPDGRLLIIDFAPHNLEFLRGEHAHVRLGFAQGEIAAWLSECGIGLSSYRELPADSEKENALTVAVWTARKPEAAAAAAREWRAAS